MDKMFMTIFHMSLAASVATLALLLIRVSTGGKMPRSVFYLCWLVVLFHMIMPFPIASGYSLIGRLLPERAITAEAEIRDLGRAEYWVGQYAAGQDAPQRPLDPGLSQKGPVVPASADLQADRESPAGRLLAPMVFSLWLAGMVTLLLINLRSYRMLRLRAETAVRSPYQMLIRACREELGIRREISVREMDGLDTPLVLGIFRPEILIPMDLRADVEQRRGIFLHELCHIRRWDHLLKVAFFVALCLHWFNPLLWVAFRYFKKDMEFSCDETVLRTGRGVNAASYADALLQLATDRGNMTDTATVTFSETDVSARIKNVLNYRKPGRKAVFSAGVLAVVLTASLLPAAAGGPGLPWSLPGKPVNARILLLCHAESQPADTILLVGYSSQDGMLRITQIPRDSFVPGLSEDAPEIVHKLGNYAAAYGPEAAMARVEELFGLELTGYAMISKDLAAQVIDHIGGLEVTVPFDMSYADPYATPPLQIDLKQGEQTLSGEDAIKFLRYRKGYETGDLGRLEMQKEALKALLAQPEKVKALFSGTSFLETVQEQLQTSLTRRELLDLYLAVRHSGLSPEKTVFYEPVMDITPDVPYYVYLQADSLKQIGASFNDSADGGRR